MLTITIDPNMFKIAVIILFTIVIIIAFIIIYRRFPIYRIYKSKIGFESMLDAVTEPLAVISRDFTVRRVNKAYINMVGGSYRTSINAKCYKLLRGLSAPCSDCRLSETLHEAAQQDVDMSPHPTGEGTISITFSPYAMPIGGNNAEICVIEHIRDITSLEKLKIDLERQNNFLIAFARKLRTAQRNINAELRTASQVQLGLFPSITSGFGKIRIDVIYQPATDVGGDLYDFIPMGDNRLGVFIGDASGHGLASALIGTLSKMSLYNHSRKSLSTSKLLEQVNRDLKAHIHTNHFLTCFWCIFDFESNNLTFSRAGHPTPLVLRKNGTMIDLKSDGIFLGIAEDAVFEEGYFAFEAGDRFFWFTDGIYEVFRKGAENDNKKENFLGDRKFTELIQQTAKTPFEEIIGTLKDNLADFRFNDDYTLIVAEICDA